MPKVVFAVLVDGVASDQQHVCSRHWPLPSLHQATRVKSVLGTNLMLCAARGSQDLLGERSDAHRGAVGIKGPSLELPCKQNKASGPKE